MFLTKTKKSPFFYLVYESNGKRTSVSTKTKNKNEALIFLRNFNPQSCKRERISDAKENKLLLSEFQNEYLDYCDNTKSAKYISSIKYSFKNLAAFTGNIPLEKVTVKTVDGFVGSSFKRTQRGAHLFYRTLKAAFNKAIEWEYIQSNPFAKIKFPKIAKRQPLFITEDDINLIVSNTEHQVLKDIFTVAFYTGLRLGELSNMKWNWIDFSRNIIAVKNSNEFSSKSKRERIVPMTELVYKIFSHRFSNQIDLNNFVFPNKNNKKISSDFVSKKFKSIIRKLNMNEAIHFHSLRHSFASSLVQKGVSLYIVKELLGHSDIATTQIYSHLQTKNLFEAMSKLE